MRILILGGTVFVGRAIVEAALARGHAITLFNRGQSDPSAFIELETITGDRTKDLSALEGRRWDAVIDTCGYLPRVVRASAQALAKANPHYTFISSLSVYADPSQPGLDETAPLGTLEDESVEEITGDTYGPLKALCEHEVQAAFPASALIIRPGLIVGPHDPTDRFTYWPYRVSRGGEVLAPGSPDRRVQFIDVRDLAEWTVRMVENGETGAFNANGPELPMPMGELLATCKSVSGSDAIFTWVSEEFLLANNVGPWMDMPLWIPESDESFAGFMAFDSSRAQLSGLTFRPLAETVRATLEWLTTRPAEKRWKAGMDLHREQELLEKWKGQAAEEIL